MPFLICLISTKTTKEDCFMKKKVLVLPKSDLNNHIHELKTNQMNKPGLKMTYPFYILIKKWFEFKVGQQKYQIEIKNSILYIYFFEQLYISGFFTIYKVVEEYTREQKYY